MLSRSHNNRTQVNQGLIQEEEIVYTPYQPLQVKQTCKPINSNYPPSSHSAPDYDNEISHSSAADPVQNLEDAYAAETNRILTRRNREKQEAAAAERLRQLEAAAVRQDADRRERERAEQALLEAQLRKRENERAAVLATEKAKREEAEKAWQQTERTRQEVERARISAENTRRDADRKRQQEAEAAILEIERKKREEVEKAQKAAEERKREAEKVQQAMAKAKKEAEDAQAKIAEEKRKKLQELTPQWERVRREVDDLDKKNEAAKNAYYKAVGQRDHNMVRYGRDMDCMYPREVERTLKEWKEIESKLLSKQSEKSQLEAKMKYV